LGSTSLSELCKNDPLKIEFIKSYFNNYFNTKIIDEYKLKSKSLMNWNWSNATDNEFLKSIEIKDPIDLLNEYFYKIFSKINQKV